MSKYKYLFKNFGLLTISSLSTKVLVFFLVPLYTSVLSTEEYGIYDNYLTTINLLLPILVCDIWQAVFRFSIDKDSDKQLYFSIGIRYGILACFVLFIFEIINYTFNILPLFNIHPYLFLIMFMVRVFSNICLEFARALDFYAQQGKEYDVVVLLQPTSPLRTVEHVKNAIALYTPDVDMVVSVKSSSAAYVMCKEGATGYLEPVVNTGVTRRQDMPAFYEYNGAVYVINVNALKEKGLGGFTKEKKYVMDEKSSWDIDTMMDWKIIEMVLKDNKK